MNEGKSSETVQGKKITGTQVILIVGIVIILAAVLGVGYLLLNQQEPAAPVATPGVGNVVVDGGFDPDAFRAKAADNMFEVKMSNRWIFPDGSSPASDAYIANSPANSLPFYFDIVYQPEGGEEEIIYTSPIIPVGSALRDITLQKDLDAGQYTVLCNYHNLYEDQTIESTVGIELTLMIEG